ncbi:MAG: Lrp/AsnC ligand binding domain-containing protein [Lentisphaeria bacterium]|nr:Lrp/AsnC ligand binding domain-containing protein [Lentisphaeria bacterium]
MVNAFVLINCADRKDLSKLPDVMLKIDGITEVYAIAGEYDYLAVVRVKDNATLSQVVTNELLKLKAIRHTKTTFALQSFSNVDLEKVFGVEG